ALLTYQLLSDLFSAVVFLVEQFRLQISHPRSLWSLAYDCGTPIHLVFHVSIRIFQPCHFHRTPYAHLGKNMSNHRGPSCPSLLYHPFDCPISHQAENTVLWTYFPFPRQRLHLHHLRG